ncbi:MAG TPA: hypothetical protein PK379_08085 [Candidatus Hydrogenedentes bacterium]|nr:hypothetical protein [Candidatus Hydrogenedentota bacterium]HOK89971.1 hypothetical protein [Candidatus Hydrogenedentota bacterium]HOV61904.1 hypothetical protein [Candidatus Hydrogenedentota bacterium]
MTQKPAKQLPARAQSVTLILDTILQILSIIEAVYRLFTMIFTSQAR